MVMYVLTDHRIPAKATASLRSYGYEPLPMPSASYLSEGVSAHPDMLLFIGFGKLFCHRRYYLTNEVLINRIARITGCATVLSDEPTDKEYPQDVLFNACLLRNKLICNKKTVSKLILATAENAGCEIIHVPQGYTKCAVCAVSENAIITADKGIATACRASGLTVLEITEGHVSLPPYEYGFLGGCSGSHREHVFFCGTLDRHPDGEAIQKFCASQGKIALSLSNETPRDVGSLIFL